jgi:hypothetical protein
MASVRGRLTRPKDGDDCAKQRKTTTVFFLFTSGRSWSRLMTSEEHPIYGKPLDRATQERLFGPARARGVVHTNGELLYVMVKMGGSAKYVNYLSRDTLLYCWPSFDGPDRRAMQRAYDKRTVFLVKVVPQGGTRTFFWGRAVIAEMEASATEFESDGVLRCINPAQRRYTITRLWANAVPDGADCPPAPSVGEVCESVAHAPAPFIPAREVELDGIHFDSVCEARHYLTMTALGLEARREPVSVEITDLLPDGWPQTWYNPDVLVVDPYKGTMLVEIKPCYPYDDEVLRCEAACRRLRLPILLFYGTDFRSPYEITRPANRSYAHAQGPRAIQWTFSTETQTVNRVDDVSYMAHDVDGTTIGFIERRRDSQDLRVYHPSVLKALEAAARRDL